MKSIEVSHYVGLSGVGGVQKNFTEYIKFNLNNKNKLLHKVFTNGKIDSQYDLPIEVQNIKKISNFIALIINIISKKKIVHFYNNLTSFKIAFLFLFLPTSKLIFHERGSSWNLPSKYGFISRFISWKSELIIANSIATKTLLVKKFSINSNKIRVIHNGVVLETISANKTRTYSKKHFNSFTIGFIGRLDTPKGAHVLIEAMRFLKDKDINLLVAGDGPLKDILMKESEKIDNIEFIGRINNLSEFYNRISLLVVPSIREPLGNVCIESGLFKVPILASNIDGIPEIISNQNCGELITPKEPIKLIFSNNSLPLPEYVVDPSTQKLIRPLQINSKELSQKILLLSTSPKLLNHYATKMYDNVAINFSMQNYSRKLHRIYAELAGVK